MSSLQLQRSARVATSYLPTILLLSFRRLKEKFPTIMPWEINPNSLFGNFWVAYTVSWEQVLDEWDAGIFSTLHP
eukprot:SAG31_NODE_39079_length_291_cov_0.796875_1_plen_74_part_10